MPFGGLFGGKGHFEPNPAKWFNQGQSEEERLAELKKLSSIMDVDALRIAFTKHAGPDEEVRQWHDRPPW
jgi:hypothetical protein